MKEHFVSTDKDYQTHVYYLKSALQFADADTTQLVSSFNREVHNNGWAGMRAKDVDAEVFRGIILRRAKRTSSSGSWPDHAL